MVAARHLSNRGYLVRVVLLGDPRQLKDDPKVNFNILKKMRVPITVIGQKMANIGSLIRKSSLIIDAIFGIGLEREVTGIFRDVIESVNHSAKPVLSIDVPSGINSDSGKVMGVAVKAAVTGTLQVVKRGLCIGAGRKLSGKVAVLDLSIPACLTSL